jgi:catechol 2,3-dioxygenase-like lactoylglutathione lyase family enzyme
MRLNLLVLRCKSIQVTKAFYEKLGLIFVQEQHGKGAVHYSTYVDEMVLEL